MHLKLSKFVLSITVRLETTYPPHEYTYMCVLFCLPQLPALQSLQEFVTLHFNNGKWTNLQNSVVTVNVYFSPKY